MKQYTTPDQTFKLMEMGFKKPMWRVARKFDDQPPRKTITSDGVFMTVSYSCEDVFAYSIGELIEMLPGRVNGIDLTIDRYYAFEQWLVYYDASQYCEAQTELIYALFGMIVKLKEEGVI